MSTLNKRASTPVRSSSRTVRRSPVPAPRTSAFPQAGVFEKFRSKAYPFQFEGTLVAKTIAGGIPSSPTVAEAWLRSKLADSDTLIRAQVAEVMVERGLDLEKATNEVFLANHLNGFKRDENGLYIEGRQLKAAIKEAANIRWPKERWGISKKGTLGFFSEHVFVVEDRLSLGVNEATGINQRFVHTWRGHGIQYEEYVENAEIDFTIITDFDFEQEVWAMLWLTGEQEGLGASRSQGFGKYTVVRWEKIR